MIVPTIKTAPGETPFAEVSLLDKATVRLRTPIDNDIRLTNFVGSLTRVKRSIQRVLTFDCLGLTTDDATQLERWRNNRTRVRPFANYGEKTVLLSHFERKRTIDDAIVPEIGDEPTFTESVGSTALATYEADDGLLYTVPTDMPRYEVGAYGMKGILVESRARQLMTQSHPTSGTLVFAIKVGAPTLAASSDIPRKVSGFADMLKVSGQSGDEVSATVTGNATSAALSIWLAGYGVVKVEVYNKTTATLLDDTGNFFLAPDWTRYDIDGLTKGSGDEFEIVIVVGVDSVFYVGPIMFAGDQLVVQQYIHNTTGSIQQKETTAVSWPGFRIPEFACTLYVLTLTPRGSSPLPNASNWICHKKNSVSPDRWGLRFSSPGGTESVYFVKRTTSPDTDVDFARTVGTHAATLIAVSYDLTNLKIYENGAHKATQALGFPVDITLDGLFLGDSEINNQACNTPISFIRIDKEMHDDTLVAQNSQLYTDEEQRVFTLACQGRDFEIKELDLRTVEGNPDQHKGTVTLVEVHSHECSTHEER